jgi:aminopeptidase N
MAVKALTAILLFLACLSLNEAVFPNRNKFIEDSPLKLQSTIDPAYLASKPRLPHNLNVFQYDIKIQPYFPNPTTTHDSSLDFTFDGTTTIYFQMLETTTSVQFDAYNLDIYAIALTSSNGIRQQLASANLDNSTNRITVAPVTFLQANQNYTVSFGYTGKINPYNYGGLFYSTYVYANGTQGNIYATFFELGDGAKSVYPCVDDPHFKAVFNLTVVAPKNMVTIANTMEDTITDIGNGYQAILFKMTKPMSTYLLAFAIGDLVSKSTTTKDGILVRIFAWAGTEMYLDEAVNTSKTCVEVMTGFTGIKFPLEKLDGLAVPHFAAGGMENWGLIVYASQYVFYDPKQDTTVSHIGGIDVRCHEIAHQWFGDLVTADWWSDIMLHESFAAYFEDYALVQGWPSQINYLDPAYVGSSIEDGFNSDGNNSHPVVTQDGTFDGVVYAKGSGLFRMLSQLLTPTIFQSAIKDYLNKYQYSTANHIQLFEAMNEIVSQTGLKDWCNNPLNVTKFMEPWLIQPHYPLLTVRYDFGSHSYFVDQQPFIPKDQLYPQEYTYAWPVPFYARQVKTGSIKQYWINRYYQCPHNFEVDASSIPGVQIPAVNDEPLIVNANSNTLARVQYDDITFNKIIDGLNQGYFQLSSETLIRMINDELALVHRNELLNGQTSYLRSMKLVAGALINNNTNSAAVFQAAKSLIDEMIRLGIDMAEKDLFENYFQTILANFYQNTHWEGNGTDDWNNNVLRERLLLYSVYFCIEDARRSAAFRFNNLYETCKSNESWVACNDVSPDLRPAIYCGAVITDNGTVFSNMKKLLQNVQQEPSPSQQERSALMEGMACTHQIKDLRNYIILATASEKGRPEDLQYLVRNSMASDVLYDIVKNTSMLATISMKPNGLEYALKAMTYNWFTPERIEMMHDLIPLLLPDQYKVFLDVYSDLLYRSKYGQGAYMEITRHLYDAYYPLGFTPWTRRLPKSAMPLTYELSVQPYIPNKSYQYYAEQNFTYDANITITMQPTTDLTEIWLNSHRHVIEGYSVLNLDTNQTLTVSNIIRDYDNAIIILIMNAVIPANANIQVCFNYSGFIFEQTPNEGTLSNYDYLQSDGRKSWIFATDFEGGPSTRSLAPSFDEPAYKAKWKVSIIYPGEFTALSNTLDESTVNLNNGLVKTTFKQTKLMSSYLLALTIGHYSCLKGVSNIDRTLVRIWTWTGMENYGQHALDFAIAAVDHMSATLNTPMPLEKFDVLALPQYSGYSAGAMENWGLVIAGYFDVLFHPDYSTSANLENIQNTVAHELVHHWFGDLVTLDWWNHIFLNEGFATFWPPEILAAKNPEQKNSVIYTKFSIHENGLAQDDNLQTAMPIVPDPNMLGPDYCLFCDTVYDKAGPVISTVRNAFGKDAAFIDGLSQYLQAWSFKNPSDTSLWTALDNIAQQYRIPGWDGQYLSVTDMMLPYTYQWSGPYIRIINKGNGIYSVAQNPLVPQSNLPFTPYNYRWNIPYRYQINGSRLSSVQYLTSTDTTLNLNADMNTPVIFNPQGQTHARVQYDDASWAPIQKAFISNPFMFDEVSRAQILADSWAFLQKKNSVTWERFLNLTVYLQKETSPLVWRYVIRDRSWISTLYDRFRYQNTTFPNLVTYINTITSGMPTPNFTLTGDWSVDTANSLMVDLKCGVNNTECMGKVAASFATFLQQCQNSAYGTGRCNPAAPDFRPAQLCYGVKQSNQYDFQTVLSLYKWWQQSPPSNDYFPQDAEFLLNGLSCSQRPDELYDLITATLNQQIPSIFLSFVAGNDNLGTILSNYLQINQANVLNSPLFKEYINQMVTSWSNQTQYDFLITFNATAPLSPNQRDIVQNAINTVTKLMNWLSTEGTPISQWLANFVASLSTTVTTILN